MQRRGGVGSAAMLLSSPAQESGHPVLLYVLGPQAGRGAAVAVAAGRPATTLRPPSQPLPRQKGRTWRARLQAAAQRRWGHGRARPRALRWRAPPRQPAAWESSGGGLQVPHGGWLSAERGTQEPLCQFDIAGQGCSACHAAQHAAPAGGGASNEECARTATHRGRRRSPCRGRQSPAPCRMR